MSSPADQAFRPLSQGAPAAGGVAVPSIPLGAVTSAPDSAALRISCSSEGFARARAFTHETLRSWSLAHRGDDAALVITELAANAVEHAMPLAPAGHTGMWLGLLRTRAHLVLTVSDPGDDPPAYTPADSSALLEYGRGLCIVDALAEEWGWTPNPPAGKTVWASLSTSPPP